MLERLIGLPEVTVLGLFTDDDRVDLHIESINERPGCAVCGVRCAVCGVRCAVCGVAAQAKGWREVVLVNLQFAGKPPIFTGTSAAGAASKRCAPTAAGSSRTFASPTPG